MLASDQFITIKKAVEGEPYKEKGSKFIGFAYPVRTEEEVKTILETLKKKHHTARHFCYAYQLGFPEVNYRANDDGEPNNSAGKPILGQIHASNLTDVLVVVLRYYGGTKLGVGGLIQAYKTAAQYCLEEAEDMVLTLKKEFQLKFEYPLLSKVMRLIKEHDIEIIKQELLENCKIKIGVRQQQAEEIENKIRGIYGVRLSRD
ncbi:MAG: YigZ family protein [Bacteroidia bacterium]|nr:YigZ family protein [Bacteroidia bacterium]MBT8270029.1 YigZ family protein [Bacteroidia bacterium]NNF81156.1 YigZ family protein [Flavobacteriaceae bacterium]NNK71185.1 YigZ family protein [Flavobacteriaceae bacterium]NNL81008.1 YigZ family protein [Flavobacteriaceae bacterium]